MRSSNIVSPAKIRNILTVSVEEYFHAGAFLKTLRPKHWDRLEERLDDPINHILERLKQFEQSATFFVLGCVADKRPGLISRIVADGHEVACSTYWPRSLRGMSPDEFHDEIQRSKEAFAKAGLEKVSGFRASRNWLGEKELWVFDELAKMGFEYDSSVNPIFWRFLGKTERSQIHTHTTDSGNNIDVFPVATIGLAGFRIGIAGGNWIRQIPHTLLKRLVQISQNRSTKPLVFYFMPWELDRHQPQLSGLSRSTRIRHYRNLGKTRWVFDYYLQTSSFRSIQDYLGLPKQECLEWVSKENSQQHGVELGRGKQPSASVSLVIPLYNEEQNVSYLRRTLLDLRKKLSAKYHIHFLLVDDGSSDNTWERLAVEFAEFEDCKLIQQPCNKGVAAAILAGIEAAPTETVCSLDCDCSYDPYELSEMIPLLDGCDLVTASPYHPKGQVLNVPPWRLFLSKTLSQLYSFVLNKRLHTFTSCCRVYRKSFVVGLQINDTGFLGVAETLIRLHLKGARITEHPATLESRVLGESKMKILHTIAGHLKFIKELSTQRHQVLLLNSPAEIEEKG